MSKKRSRRQAKENLNSDYELDTYGLADGDDKSRPYYMVEDLSSSIEVPRYDTLNYPLSVKDSAVLYTSLLSSRRTWVKGEMFQLYWAKQYMNIKEREELKKEGIDPDSIDQSAARERMNKLCDCMMQGGPHQFPIRLFILKNDEVEKAWVEAKEAKKRDREVRKKQQEEEKRLKKERKLLRKKLKQEALEREKEKNKNKEKVKKPRKPYKKSAKRLEAEKNAKKNESAKQTPITTPKSTKPSTTSAEGSAVKKKKTKAVVRPKPYEEQVMILNLNKMARNDKQLNDLMIKVAGGHASLAEITLFKKYIEKAKAMPPPSGTWKPMLEEVDVTDDEDSDEEQKKATGDPEKSDT
ncbi:SWR1-complex protein 3, partial [Kluyveromyces marxianus]